MIRIRRPKQAPSVLAAKGTAKTAEHCASVVANTPLDFDRDIYGAKDVKDVLAGSHRGKCCFCESKILHVASGDVEHFRPKAGVYSTSLGKVAPPGYYWLAYEWTNLLFSCEQCNRRGKKNHFPLLDESKRASAPTSALSDERPVFIDPTAEDPARHVGFRDEIAFGRTARGKATIDALMLNRAPLRARRAEVLGTLRALRRAEAALARRSGKKSQAELAEVRAALRRLATPRAEYWAMRKCAGV